MRAAPEVVNDHDALTPEALTDLRFGDLKPDLGHRFSLQWLMRRTIGPAPR
jgi:hypothetical protein